MILIRCISGLGMSKIAQKSFEKFYREHTGNIHNEGHGCDQLHVKRIVEDHHGSICRKRKGKGVPLIIKYHPYNLKIPQIKYTMENINKRIL
jgi:signal transduction histidine kinase